MPYIGKLIFECIWSGSCGRCEFWAGGSFRVCLLICECTFSFDCDNFCSHQLSPIYIFPDSLICFILRAVSYTCCKYFTHLLSVLVNFTVRLLYEGRTVGVRVVCAVQCSSSYNILFSFSDIFAFFWLPLKNWDLNLCHTQAFLVGWKLKPPNPVCSTVQNDKQQNRRNYISRWESLRMENEMNSIIWKFHILVVFNIKKVKNIKTHFFFGYCLVSSSNVLRTISALGLV